MWFFVGVFFPVFKPEPDSVTPQTNYAEFKGHSCVN